MTLLGHIKKALPSIRDTILELICKKEFDLKQYGGDFDF